MKFTTSFILSSIFSLSAVPYTAAHGYLKAVTIDGTVYAGNVPNNAKVSSPIRLIDDVDPVKGASNPNLACGQNAQPAALVASANPGSSFAFAWANGGGGNWPHNTGPLLAYMASCGSTTCDQFDASTAQWFKIDQAGKTADGSAWVQQDIMNGGTYNITLPNDIAPGGYLVRHEIIALQGAMAEGGAEFYPSCTQITVGGSGTGVPNATVSFPGGYTDTEPGILDPDVYQPGSSYTFPGPPIAAIIVSGAGNAASAPSAGTSSTDNAVPTAASSSAVLSASATSSATDVPPANTPSSTPPSVSVAAPSATSSGESGCDLRPHGYSRIMRRLVH